MLRLVLIVTATLPIWTSLANAGSVSIVDTGAPDVALDELYGGANAIIMRQMPANTIPAAAFGLTFTVPDNGPTITDFSFFLKDFNLSGPLNRQLGQAAYYGFVMQWDAANFAVTGDVLFQSALQLEGGNSSSFVEQSVQTGGLELQVGTEYIAFFSGIDMTSNRFNRSPGFAFIGGDDDPSDGTPPATGISVVSNASVTSWTQLFLPGAFSLASRDLAAIIHAQSTENSTGPDPVVIPDPALGDTPEPAALLMWTVFGLFGAAYEWRRRRRRT